MGDGELTTDSSVAKRLIEAAVNPVLLGRLMQVFNMLLSRDCVQGLFAKVHAAMVIDSSAV